MKSSNRCLVMCIGLGDQTVAVKLLGCLILVGVFPMMVFSELADRSVDGCGHTVMSRESGTLSSNNYPGPYPNNTSCTWKIRVAQGKAILLKFSDLDIETQSCELDYLKIVTVSSEEKTYCRTLDPEERELLLDTNEAKIQFASAVHVSGRGFLLSYATSDHSDLISCLDRSSHYTEEQYSKYCPAGCKDVAGDIFGDSSDGYRDTSVICKAAVHAGVIADESGGQITVIKSKVLGRYNVVRANGITSKEDSLSERIFLFNRTVRPDYINKLVDVSTDPTGITGNQNITEPISHQEADFGVKIGIAAAVVLCLFLLLAAVCIWQALHKRKSKGDAYRLSGDHGTGCWKQAKQPFLRHQSTEFTISYSREKPLQKLDLVTYDMSDCHEFVTIGTVTRKGSTFKPMDTEVEDELNLSETQSLYDSPHKTTRHEYALPLTSQEPEYATPIIKRHAIKNIYTPRTGYKVPSVSLTQIKKASNSFSSFNNSSTSDSSGGSGYQIPQCIVESKMTEEMKYDQPRHINMAAVDCGNDYQKPQSSSVVQVLYSTPRDCVKSVDHEQQGDLCLF